ncbi:hypothetical protein D9Q98_002706 [Chlorella vulgaris]|uniref:Splicing factor cactin central domain-containing protein n=1 Tax=Chlorella vulgaris TaxID=3077 RepID=A0A9D4TV80_CHLVU|nr:hypothetical protein D9Q98_002706 [Chlorella vulgaris]
MGNSHSDETSHEEEMHRLAERMDTAYLRLHQGIGLRRAKANSQQRLNDRRPKPIDRLAGIVFDLKGAVREDPSKVIVDTPLSRLDELVDDITGFQEMDTHLFLNCHYWTWAKIVAEAKLRGEPVDALCAWYESSGGASIVYGDDRSAVYLKYGQLVLAMEGLRWLVMAPDGLYGTTQQQQRLPQSDEQHVAAGHNGLAKELFTHRPAQAQDAPLGPVLRLRGGAGGESGLDEMEVDSQEGAASQAPTQLPIAVHSSVATDAAANQHQQQLVSGAQQPPKSDPPKLRDNRHGPHVAEAKETRTIKCNILDIVRNSQLLTPIRATAVAVTQLKFEGFEFLRLLVPIFCSARRPIPPLVQNFIYHILACVAELTKFGHDIQLPEGVAAVAAEYMRNCHHYLPLVQRDGLASVIESLATLMEVNIQEHFRRNFPTWERNWVRARTQQVLPDAEPALRKKVVTATVHSLKTGAALVLPKTEPPAINMQQRTQLEELLDRTLLPLSKRSQHPKCWQPHEFLAQAYRMQQDIEKAREAAAPQLKDLQQRLQSVLADAQKQQQQEPAAAGQPSRKQAQQQPAAAGQPSHGNKPAVAADVDGSKARPANDDVGNNEGAERGGASGDEEMQDVPGQACEVDEQQRPQAGAGDQALPDQQQPPADQPFTRKQKRRWIYKQKIREKAARENAGQPAAAAHAQAV